MQTDWRIRHTIDRLAGNIPLIRQVLSQEGYVSLAGQLKQDRDNLLHWLTRARRPDTASNGENHTMTLETETSIPTPVIKSIHTILLQAFDVKVPYSDDPLEMAQAAIDRQKDGISQILDLIQKHYPWLKETTP